MTRKSEYFVGVVFPTNSSRYQCIIGQERYRERQTALGRWQPSADDLLADDWVLEDEIF
ncbi:DUF2829 domain-containing protein [Staphylococcus auricularis]|nr:DUF2829 domain-containing protein [Staphylococcus auricularis]